MYLVLFICLFNSQLSPSPFWNVFSCVMPNIPVFYLWKRKNWFVLFLKEKREGEEGLFFFLPKLLATQGVYAVPDINMALLGVLCPENFQMLFVVLSRTISHKCKFCKMVLVAAFLLLICLNDLGNRRWFRTRRGGFITFHSSWNIEIAI